MAITRREALELLGVALGAAATGACGSSTGSGSTTAKKEQDMSQAATTKQGRMPVIYLPHGGGPWPLMDDPRGMYAGLEAYLRGLLDGLPRRPKAVLMISAHWEEPTPTVMSATAPTMLYDYGGFPAHTYEFEWPGPGDAALAGRVRELLEGAGIDSAADEERGFDHGTFVPMMLIDPEAQMPTVQLSLQRGLDPARHRAIGRALAPLRDEGVLILGSGMSYHNLRAMLGRAPSIAEDSQAFDDWLVASAAEPAQRRDAALDDWQGAPKARACHPREEHLLPLMVVAGAAGADRGRVSFSDRLLGARVSALHFG